MGMTLCPGKYQPVASTGSWDRQLDVDLDDLVTMGTQRLVSLVTEEDMRMLRVETWARCPKQGHGMESPPYPRHHCTNSSWLEDALPVLEELVSLFLLVKWPLCIAWVD